MSEIRLLLVAREGEARKAYEATLGRLGVEFDAVSSFGSIYAVAGEKAYNGLLLDVLTLVRTKNEEKTIAYECINYYPSTRIKWDGATGRVILLRFDQSSPLDSESALKMFIEGQCRPFQPRTVRKSARKDILLNARLSRSSTMEDAVRTFSVNVSRGGAYIHTVDEFTRGEKVWLQFEELFKRATVEAEVCWHQPWGVRRAIAGIGVRFLGICEEQDEDLTRVLKG